MDDKINYEIIEKDNGNEVLLSFKVDYVIILPIHFWNLLNFYIIFLNYYYKIQNILSSLIITTW